MILFGSCLFFRAVRENGPFFIGAYKNKSVVLSNVGFLFPTNLFFRKIVATFDVLNFMGKVTSFLFRFAYGMC